MSWGWKEEGEEEEKWILCLLPPSAAPTKGMDGFWHGTVETTKMFFFHKRTVKSVGNVKTKYTVLLFF